MVEETARYVYRIMAAKILFSNPSAFGFRLKASDLYLPLAYKEVTVTNKEKSSGSSNSSDSSRSGSVKTCDDTPIARYLGLLALAVIAVLAIAVILLKRRKQNN